MNVIKTIVGFILANIVYVIAFVLCGILIEISLSFVLFLPPAVDTYYAPLTASAIGANGLAAGVFTAFDKNKKHEIAFGIWLIVISTLYLIACFISSDIHLIWYSILSYILAGMMIHSAMKEEPD